MSNDVEINMELIPKKNDRKEYEKYKKKIGNRKHGDFELLTFVKRKENGEPSEFEEILISNDDKSAIISLVQRELKLGCDKHFWSTHVDLDRVMKHYATDENANLKNLFSILVFDWHESATKQYGETYLLMHKFHKFDKNSKKTLFEKLCEITNKHKHFGYLVRFVIKEYISEVLEANVFKMQRMLLDYAHIAMIIERYQLRSSIVLDLVQILLKSDIYEEIKLKVIEALHCEIKFESVYKKSLKYVNSEYNQAYIELYFMLVERKMEAFKKKFEEFLEKSKHSYGDHWRLYTTNEINLLLTVTCTIELAGVHSFIRSKFTFFERALVGDHMKVTFNEPLNNELETLNVMDILLKEYKPNDIKSKQKVLNHLKKFNNRLLLGRRHFDDLSVLERITMDSKFCNILQTVWSKFHLWEEAMLLVDDNHPKNRTIVDFLLDSKDDEQIFAFLSIPDSEENRNNILKKHKQYMMFFSSQMCAHENYRMCFVEYCIDLIIRKKYDLVEKSRRYLMYYLEEVGEVKIPFKDSVIEKLINASEDTTIESKQLSEIDRILRCLIIFWKYEGEFYFTYKTQIISHLPSHELLFYIIENKFEHFFQFYEAKMKILAVNLINRYDGYWCREITETFKFDILYLAMRKNQPKVVEFIITRLKSKSLKTYLPENIEAHEIHHQTAFQLMQERNQIVVENFPEEWFTVDVLKDFLNSKITVFNQEYIEMDLSFMIDNEIPTLEYLNDKGSLLGKEIILHPTIETYVNLRSYKYNRIYQMNYLAFMFLFLFPFIPLMFSNEKRKIDKSYRAPYGLEYLHYISIGYLIIRETFQFIIEESKLDYFKQTSNKNELFLITTSITLSVCSLFFYEEYSIMILEILFILTATISATTLNFLTKDPVYIKILRKISMIFLKIMHVFIVILLGLAFCLYIVLDDEQSSEDREQPSSESYIKEPIASFLRVLTMMSGEFNFSFKELKTFQVVFSLFFVITSFILFNLILGISFENIESIMNESRQLNVLDKIKKLLHMEQRFETSKSRMKKNQKSYLASIFDFFTRKYQYVHALEKIYINVSDKNVYVRDAKERQKVLKQSNRKRGGYDYRMDDETYKEIKNIEKEKEEKKSKMQSRDNALEIWRSLSLNQENH